MRGIDGEERRRKHKTLSDRYSSAGSERRVWSGDNGDFVARIYSRQAEIVPAKGLNVRDTKKGRPLTRCC